MDFFRANNDFIASYQYHRLPIKKVKTRLICEVEESMPCLTCLTLQSRSPFSTSQQQRGFPDDTVSFRPASFATARSATAFYYKVVNCRSIMIA